MKNSCSLCAGQAPAMIDRRLYGRSPPHAPGQSTSAFASIACLLAGRRTIPIVHGSAVLALAVVFGQPERGATWARSWRSAEKSRKAAQQTRPPWDRPEDVVLPAIPATAVLRLEDRKSV